jgi:hypothetical protein
MKRRLILLCSVALAILETPMKRKLIVLSSVTLLLFGVCLWALPQASDPAQAKALQVRYAESSIRAGILDRFPDPSGTREPDWTRGVFRGTPHIRPTRPKSQYTMALVEHAPEGKTTSDICQPFEIYEPSAYANTAPPVLMFGYCEITPPPPNTSGGQPKVVVFLYVAAELKYVPAAEHPLLVAQVGNRPNIQASPRQ